MLQAFIDESSKPGREFVLGGHIATAEAWAAFAAKWELLLPFGTLAKNGKYHFKMSEMARSPAAMKRVPLFYQVIEDHVAASISCRFNLEDFARALERAEMVTRHLGWQVNFGIFNNPYFLGFRGLLGNFHEKREQVADALPRDEKVEFIFDKRTEEKPIRDSWEDYVAVQPEEVRAQYGANPRFEDDQDFLPLQAADFWAWWVREWYEEDAAEIPDKMAAFDFGEWRSKKRPCIAINLTEEALLDMLQSMAFSRFVEVNSSVPD